MRKILITLDDDLDPWLATFPNQTEVVRTALHVYKEHITPEVVKGLRRSFTQINRRIDNIDQNIMRLAQRAGSEYAADEFTEFGV